MATAVPTYTELIELVSTCAGVEVDGDAVNRDPGIGFEDLDVDSLSLLGVISTLESRYATRFDIDLENCSTFHDLMVAVSDGIAGPHGHTVNTIVIGAPYDRVWDMTNDVPSWTTLFSEYAEATVLERTGDRVRFRLTLFPDENGTSWSWVSERLLDRSAGVVTAWRVEPGPFEYMNIRWTYRTVPDGVAMRWEQDFHMKPEAPVDDAQMAARINKNSPIQMERIKKVIEGAA